MNRREYFRSKSRKKWMKSVLLVIIGAVSAVAVAFISLRIYAQIAGAPTLSVPKASIFLDSQNNQIGDYYTGERRYWVSLDEISPYLTDATIAVEDKDFYQHSGFDYSRIAGAVLADIKAGNKVQGASTLTQQYARNLYLTHEKTWTRKINEALYAYRLEVFYGKDEILEGYLNTVYYGHGMYGAEAASHYYFGKPASDLTLAEAALLAGIPKGPTYYSPLVDEKKATNRQQVILGLMENQGKITAAEKDRATQEQLVFKSDDWVASKNIAPYFLDAVWEEAGDILESKNLNIREGGWTIKTTLNQAHQQAAEQAVAEHMPDSELQIGLVSMDPKTGFVTALVGGRDYQTSSFNRVTLAERQPGSAIKPFLYSAALENGYTPMTFKDVSQTVFTYDNGRKTYAPKNVNGQFASEQMSLAQALAISDNIYAVKTLEDIGYGKFRNMLERFKLNTTKEESPSIALGTIETSLYSLTNAYNILAAGGESREATMIISIENAKGEVVYEYEPPKEEQLLAEEDAYIMTQMMTGIFDPVLSDYSPATGVSIRSRMTHTYAAKSGSTNSDQWMVGYSPNVTVGVWNGYDQGKTLSGQADTGATKQVWIDFMESVHNGLPNEEFAAPSDVEGVVVDVASGKIANDGCPNEQRLVYMKAEDVPTEQCSTYWFNSDWFNAESWEDSWDSLLNWLPFEAFRNPDKE
ncbi:transglycosylase domain-containing protein [Lysinibacillus odysseyi]|uniref:Penicillin-binding protein n=1 Tax=Lysinibacillus odysseyi 34hs-1 = NBRC 100172 TaxID=1220589 RepID=A0A0A3ILT8_9BACI|nr:PBP1A family penicillin-binding protein [Lysinibacillus odysseyi]KGR85734.1 penicillin-binding protein [Lysinibacillus odysseyi 34hs-1 = NBRC 100172]